VTSLSSSLDFYETLLGFVVLYDRPEERFAMIDLGGARMMLEEADGPGRRFRTAALERPFGRGVNLQIEVEDARALHQRVVEAGYDPLVPLEERWYRSASVELGNRQFVLSDPDGYLLRFFTDLGSRPLQPTSA
jgi:catechol 2,3-dioxygenase-like lactoylglutathione lyase family enzyme